MLSANTPPWNFCQDAICLYVNLPSSMSASNGANVLCFLSSLPLSPPQPPRQWLGHTCHLSSLYPDTASPVRDVIRSVIRIPLATPWGLQRDVVYLCWPIAPSYTSPNEYSCTHHVTWSSNKLWRSGSSIFNLWATLSPSHTIEDDKLCFLQSVTRQKHLQQRHRMQAVHSAHSVKSAR